MSWLGVGIGAGIGAMIGGPIGAALGAWAGHSISERYSGAKDVVVASWQANQKEAQSIFFATLFSMLAKMAKADGRVAQKEADVINELARTHLKMDDEDRAAASTIFKNALNDDYSIYDYAKQYRRIAGNQQMCEMVYRLLFTVAYADHELHPAEDEILHQVLPLLGLDQSYYQILKEEFLGQQADINECYKVLGVAPESSDTEIKRAYRKLCMEYHPDKISAKGLPEKFMKVAEQQMHLINNAYDTITKARKD